MLCIQYADNKPSTPGSIEIFNAPNYPPLVVIKMLINRDYPKNCVNFLDAIMHKEVTWYSTGIN